MRSTKVVLVGLILAVACLPSVATADEIEVRVQESSFSWTGKEDGIAGYEWSATLDNPGRRTLDVEVTLELLDDADTVIETRSVVATLEPEARTRVGGPGSLPYPEAQRIGLFRVTLRAADDVP